MEKKEKKDVWKLCHRIQMAANKRMAKYFEWSCRDANTYSFFFFHSVDYVMHLDYGLRSDGKCSYPSNQFCLKGLTALCAEWCVQTAHNNTQKEGDTNSSRSHLLLRIVLLLLCFIWLESVASVCVLFRALPLIIIIIHIRTSHMLLTEQKFVAHLCELINVNGSRRLFFLLKN